MTDITLKELVRKKLETERKIMEGIKKPIIEFQKETGIGIQYIDIEMVYVSWQEGTPKYLVGNVSIKMDLDFTEALDRIDMRTCSDEPEQLTLFGSEDV